MTPWPNTRYAIVVPTWTGEAPCGLGWRIHERGHAPLAKQVRETVERSGVTPDYLMVHCPGAAEILPGGKMEMAVDGLLLAEEAGHNAIVDTLDAWGDLADAWSCPAWLYMGRAESERLRLLTMRGYIRRVEWCLDKAREVFDGVFFDSSANGWGSDYYGEQMLAEAIEIARDRGLQSGCEAWPQKIYEPTLAGCPVWMTHTPFAGNPGSWATQHPLMRAGNWQAPPDNHVGMVHVVKHPAHDYQLTPELAQKISATNCIVGVNFDQWDQLGLPGRGPKLKEMK